MTTGEVYLDIKEVPVPQTNAQLVAENVALQLEKRVAFRKAMKKVVASAMSKGALGIKIQCKGRLGGSEIARAEGYKEGKVPLSTFRADVAYGFAEAFTTYGTIGVKVWTYHGDVLVKKEEERKTSRRGSKLIGSICGTKSTSIWFKTWLYQRLESKVVCAQRLQPLAP